MNCVNAVFVLLSFCALLFKTGAEVMDDGGRESNTMPVQCCGSRVKMSQEGLAATEECRKELPDHGENSDARLECYGKKVGFDNNEGFIDNLSIWRKEVTSYFLERELNELAGKKADVCKDFGNWYGREHYGQPNPATRAAVDCIVYLVQQNCKEDDPAIRQKCKQERDGKSNWFVAWYGSTP